MGQAGFWFGVTDGPQPRCHLGLEWGMILFGNYSRGRGQPQVLAGHPTWASP